MAISKRESRLRRWAKKLSGCLRHCQPHLRYKSDYLEIEKTGSQPVYRANNQNPPRSVLFGRREQPPKKSRSEGSTGQDRSSMRALPSIGKLGRSAPPDVPGNRTIRIVDPSKSSLLLGRASHNNTVESTRQQEGILQKNPHGVLPWKESFQIQKAINQGMPEHSTHKHDSATDLSLRPFQTRPHEARKSHGPPKPPPKPTTGARICHRRPINPQAAFTSSNTVAGWDQDWDKPLHHRIGDTKAIWKSGSHRLMVRNKDSIRRLDSDKTTREKVKGRMVSDKRQASQVRSIESIEEMAEEDRLAYEEWTGIATQIAAEGPDIQEVRSVSYRHRQHPLARPPIMDDYQYITCL
ncbi:hypothetical protein PTMSG1_00527 [Pyrenophora teres f. maculata]|nr:hypothetical protein PTMSG1_00527 [Pyrenophora teres f. maculata]